VRLTPGSFARAGAIAFAIVVLQISGLGSLQIFGATPNLIPLGVAAVAIYAGSISGASMGFATGLILDLAVGSPVGVSSLALTAVGYGVGRYREVRDPAHGLMPIPVGAAATLGFLVTFAAVSFMLDVGPSVSGLIFGDMLVATLVAAALAVPVFSLCRRVLRPALTVDPFERKRRRGSPRQSGPLGLRGMEI
jgi:rod shape-determining protein MreD